MPWRTSLIANPGDDNALLRVVNFPARGIGMRSLEQLQDDAGRQGGSLWDSNAGNRQGVQIAEDRRRTG